MFTYRPRVHIDRLNEAEVGAARQFRLKEIQMWKSLHEICLYLCFLILLSMMVYSNPQNHSFNQVQHLRKYFLNTRQSDNNYLKVRSKIVLFFLNYFLIRFPQEMNIGNG